jgi:hypothetical protein
MANKIKSLSVHAQIVFQFLDCLAQEKNLKKSFCILLCKHLLILKIVPKAASNFFSGSSVHSWPVFAQFSESQAAFGTTLGVTGG